jgi:hypothetical protein
VALAEHLVEVQVSGVTRELVVLLDVDTSVSRLSTRQQR